MSSRDCVLCNTTFSTVSNLNKHLKRKHTELLPQVHIIISSFINVRP